MKSQNQTPVETFNRLHQFVKNHDADGQAGLFAEDGIWEFPFATGRIPRKVEGRENIRAFGKKAREGSRNAGRSIVKYNSVVVHGTQDRNTINVEFELEGEVIAKSIRNKIPYIQLLKVHNGQIVLLRDYFSIEILKNVLEN